MSFDIAALGLEVDAAPVDKATASLTSFAKSAADAEGAAKRLNRTATDMAGIGQASRGAAEAVKRNATDYITAGGVVEQATRAAEREMATAARTADLWARRIENMEKAIDPASAATITLAQRTRDLQTALDKGGIDAERQAAMLAKVTAAAEAGDVGLSRFSSGVAAGVDSSKALQQAGLNLSRQFADVGVSLAGGISPMMVLIQQGPQIADAFAMAKMQGLGFSAVLKGLAASAWSAIAPFAPFIAGAAAVAAVLGGGLMLATREINKEHQNFASTLGLTAKQMEHLKDKGTNLSITLGDTFKALFQVVGKDLTKAFHLDDAGKAIGKFLDWTTEKMAWAASHYVGLYVGAFEAIVAAWKALPAAFSDIVTTAANLVLRGLTITFNAIIDQINKLISGANAAAQAVGLNLHVPTLNDLVAKQFANPNTGAAAHAGKAVGEAWAKGMQDGVNATNGFLKDWSAQAAKNAADRITKAAGHGKDPKAARTPRDMTDEATAQVAQQIAQAMQEELQARLAITSSAQERADLEKQLAAAQVEEKQAQLRKQIATINDPKNKSLDDATKKELTAELQGVAWTNMRVAALHNQAIDEQLRQTLVHEAAGREQDALELQEEHLKASASLLKSSYARAVAEVDILKVDQQLQLSKAQEAVDAARIGSTERDRAEAALQRLQIEQQTATKLAEEQTSLLRGVEDATDAVRSFKNAFRRHDWADVFDQLQRTIDAVKASFLANSWKGGALTAGSVVASLIGGKTGNAVGTGLGIAGLGLSLGASAGSLGAALSVGGSLSSLGTLGIGGALSTVAPFLGPIGAALGAGYALYQLLGNHPSNHGAGYDLVTGQLSGNKRSSETESAAQGAGQAILQGEDILKQAGITLATTVTGLVIGTRDLTDIQLSNGKHLTSAVGDAAAATDTALKAVLQGATYTSDAQKQLVESMVAAGKGFDDISTALQAYAQAQTISGSLADQILQLKSPQAYDEKMVKDAIEDQRKAAQTAADAGYLTATQLADINSQLTELQGLQLDAVLERYATAVDDASDALDAARSAAANQLSAANDAVSAARDALTASYQAQQQAISATSQKFSAFANSLSDFSKSLATGDLAALDPQKQYAATRAEFMRLAALPAGDEERLAGLQSAGQAFLAASRAIAPTQLAYNSDLAAVRSATDASAKAATDQVDVAEQQLKALDAQVAGLIDVNRSVLSVTAAVLALNGALTALAAAQAVSNAANKGAANDDFDVATYLRDNPDIAKAYTGYASGAYTYGLPAGMTADQFGLYHYLTTGQEEIAQGLRKYAAGGLHPGGLRLVGEEGPELEVTGPSRIYSAADTRRMLSGDDGSADELRALREEVADLKTALTSALKDVAKNTKKTSDTLTNVTRDGVAMITTEAA